VVGFVPKRINDGRVHVAWAGRIVRILTMSDYEKQYVGRQDAIYKMTISGWEFLRHDYHEEIRERDLNGKNALVFEPFWYWAGLVSPPRMISRTWHTTTSGKLPRTHLQKRLRAWKNGCDRWPNQGSMVSPVMSCRQGDRSSSPSSRADLSRVPERPRRGLSRAIESV